MEIWREWVKDPKKESGQQVQESETSNEKDFITELGLLTQAASFYVVCVETNRHRFWSDPQVKQEQGSIWLKHILKSSSRQILICVLSYNPNKGEKTLWGI